MGRPLWSDWVETAGKEKKLTRTRKLKASTRQGLRLESSSESFNMWLPCMPTLISGWPRVNSNKSPYICFLVRQGILFRQQQQKIRNMKLKGGVGGGSDEFLAWYQTQGYIHKVLASQVSPPRCWSLRQTNGACKLIVESSETYQEHVHGCGALLTCWHYLCNHELVPEATESLVVRGRSRTPSSITTCEPRSWKMSLGHQQPGRRLPFTLAPHPFLWWPSTNYWIARLED